MPVSGNARDGLLDEMTSFLLKQGNLTLAARISLVFKFLNRDLDAICSALALAKGTITCDEIPEWIIQEVQQPNRRGSGAVLFSDIAVGEDDVVRWLRTIYTVCTLGRDVVVAVMDNYVLTKLLQVTIMDDSIQDVSKNWPAFG